MAGNAVSDWSLPLGAEIDADGLWSQVLNRAQGAGLRPGLFLDRDGVMNKKAPRLIPWGFLFLIY